MRPDLAVSKDPIDYSKLPPPALTADMQTQEVTGPHPNYGGTPDDVKRLYGLLVLPGVAGLVSFIVLRAIEEQLGFLGVIGAGVATALYGAKWLVQRKAPDWQVRTAVLTPVPLFVGLTLLAKLVYYPGLGVMTLGLPALGLMLLLVHRVSRHHGLWYTAIPAVSLDDRDRWRQVINGRGPWRERGSYYLRMAATVALFLACVSFTDWRLGIQFRTLALFILVVFVVTAACNYLLRLDYRVGTSAHPLVALHNFIGYNRHDCQAPGVWQSPYGSQFRRQTVTVGVLFLLSFAFASSLSGVNSPIAFFWLCVMPALDGQFFPIYVIATMPLCVVFPGLAYLYVAHFVAGPRLNHIDRELGHWWFSDQACPGHSFFWRVWKLTTSKHEVHWNGETIREADHLTLGRAVASDYPFLVHNTILDEHAQILGGSGSGKTSRAVGPICAQRMRHGHSLAFIDLKGSDDTLAALTVDAILAAGQMKHFTLDSRATFGWNPFLEPFFQKMDPAGRALYLAKALSLDSGEGYGRSFFSESNLNLLRALLTEFPEVKSFRELSEAAQAIKSFKAATADEVEDARQVLLVIRTLAAIPALNITPENTPSEVFERRIQLYDLVRALKPGELRQHVYFHLSALKNDMAARHVARMVVFGVLAVAADRGPEDKTPVTVAIDEAQRIATPETLDLLLQQSRSFKVSTILAHQSLGDLRKPSGDLTKTVFNNTRLRICFGVADPEDIQTLVRASADAAYETPSWAVSEEDLQAGNVGMGRNRNLLARVNTTVGPRIGATDLVRMTDDKELAWVNVQRGAGYTRFGGEPLIVRMPYYISPDQFEAFKKQPWPSQPGTFVPAPFDPAATVSMELPAWLVTGIPGAAPLPALPPVSPELSPPVAPAKRGRPKKQAADPLAALPPVDTGVAPADDSAEDSATPATPTTPPERLVTEDVPKEETPVETVPASQGLLEPTPDPLLDSRPHPRSGSDASPPEAVPEIVLPELRPTDRTVLEVIGHAPPPKKRGRPKKAAPTSAEPPADVVPLPGMDDLMAGGR